MQREQHRKTVRQSEHSFQFSLMSFFACTSLLTAATTAGVSIVSSVRISDDALTLITICALFIPAAILLFLVSAGIFAAMLTLVIQTSQSGMKLYHNRFQHIRVQHSRIQPDTEMPVARGPLRAKRCANR